jgi:hypothetical protein
MHIIIIIYRSQKPLHFLSQLLELLEQHKKGDLHFGGSCLLAQICCFLWDNMQFNIKKMPAIIGRNKTLNNLSIIPQNYGLHAHIRICRVEVE